MADAPAGPPGTFIAPATAILFGFDSTSAEATIRPRARAWRIGGAARTMAVAVALAPAVAVIPPHAPWLIGALAVGGILARRRLQERFTLTAVSGSCPKCGAPLQVKSGRLRRPHPLPCEVCHHESTLQVEERALAAHRAETE